MLAGAGGHAQATRWRRAVAAGADALRQLPGAAGPPGGARSQPQRFALLSCMPGCLQPAQPSALENFKASYVPGWLCTDTLAFFCNVLHHLGTPADSVALSLAALQAPLAACQA